MGSLHSSPLSALISDLQKHLSLRSFVETGTFRGDGAAFAASVFADVHTIEIRQDFHDKASERLAPLGVTQHLGDSRTVLPKVAAQLGNSALFWLDGHAGGGYFGDADDCPLIEELQAIAQSDHEHVILVDDARAFVAPPPPPFKAQAWPTLIEVIDAARARVAYDCVIICDALIFTPPTARDVVGAFVHRVRPKI